MVTNADHAMLDNLKLYSLVLASNSPRRRELLLGLGLDFVVRVPEDFDESYPTALDVSQVAEYIAVNKGKTCEQSMRDDELILTADTVVCLNGVVFGKPNNRAEALHMLNELSGQQHWVYTGVCLTSKKMQTSFTAKTKVFFSSLTEAEMTHYVDVFKPFDKAGAYGVQEWIGSVAVERIEGSYFNIMGLPVHQLYQVLKEFPHFES